MAEAETFIESNYLAVRQNKNGGVAMKKNYGLLTGCLVVAALGVIYAGVGAYQAHTKEKEQQQAVMYWHLQRMAIPGRMTATTSFR